MSAFLGMRGNGDWITNQRPENWREMILYLYPNGSAPLTAIMAMLGSESTNDPTFHWWTKGLPSQGGAVTETYTDANLSAAASGAKTSGTTLYAKVAEAVADEFRIGHTAMFQKGSNHNYAYVGKVVDVLKNGASSYIAVKLVEATNTTYDVGSSDYIDVVGTVNAEGATMPSALSYDPVEYYNYTQIFRTPLSITRTARKTRLRTGDQYKEAKREALELHSIEMEKAFIFGERYSGIGTNGKPERMTRGIRKWILNEASANVDNYVSNTSYNSQTWTEGGEDWLNEKLEVIFREGPNERVALCGSGALLGIQRLAKAGSEVNLTPGAIGYGLKVMTWMTPFGTIHLKTHPLFSDKEAFRNDMMILSPSNLKFRYIDDTFFVADPQDRRNRNNSMDGTEEEFITEGGLELHHPSTFGYLSGFNQDNN